MGRSDFREIMRNETGTLSVAVDAEYGRTREVKITITRTRSGKTTTIELDDLDPDASDTLGVVFRNLSEWQWWAEEDAREEDKRDLRIEPEEPPLFYTYKK
jgi:hypothetical protein